MLQVLEWWPKQQETSLFHSIYLHITVILIFIPLCSIWAEQKFIWCHPLISWWPPLRSYFVHHPLLPQVNLQVLSNSMRASWPGTGTSTSSDIVKTGLPWFRRALMHDTKKLLLHRLVSYYFPFQGAECGILWAERQIPSYLHSLVGVIPIKPTKRLSALMAGGS